MLPLGRAAWAADVKKPLYTISLAEWSLHKTLLAGKMKNIDFPQAAKADYGIDAVEYVNTFFKDKAKDTQYLTDLKQRAADAGGRNVLIMVDGEGALGDADEAKRTQGHREPPPVGRGRRSSWAAMPFELTPRAAEATTSRRSGPPTGSAACQGLPAIIRSA